MPGDAVANLAGWTPSHLEAFILMKHLTHQHRKRERISSRRMCRWLLLCTLLFGVGCHHTPSGEPAAESTSTLQDTAAGEATEELAVTTSDPNATPASTPGKPSHNTDVAPAALNTSPIESRTQAPTSPQSLQGLRLREPRSATPLVRLLEIPTAELPPLLISQGIVEVTLLGGDEQLHFSHSLAALNSDPEQPERLSTKSPPPRDESDGGDSPQAEDTLDSSERLATKPTTVLLWGMLPQTDYQGTVQISLREETAPHSRGAFEFRTGDALDHLPQITLRHAEPERMEPGLTLFNLLRYENNFPDYNFGAILAVDHQGRIRWSYRANHFVMDVKQLPNGHLLYGYGNRADGLIEIDLQGNIMRRWDAARRGRTVAPGAIPVDVDTLHHDVALLDDQTWLALATTLYPIEPYYDPSYHPRQRIPHANLVGDEIVEMRTTGEVLRRYSLFELLDPRRIGYGSLHSFWDTRGYEEVEGGTFDWSHSNSIVHDPRDNSFIVSVRHQDAVIKVDRTAGELKWILGNPKNWRGEHSRKRLTPIGRPKWPYHQHAVQITPHGTLLMFDNGSRQAMPFDREVPAPLTQSRAVEYRVDEVANTVEQVWEYDGGEEKFYSPFLCDIDWLPQRGNVLITNGGNITDAEGLPTDIVPGHRQWAEIYEVTHPGTEPSATSSHTSQKVFDLLIEASPQHPHTGWSIYRSERTENLFSRAN